MVKETKYLHTFSFQHSKFLKHIFDIDIIILIHAHNKTGTLKRPQHLLSPF